MKKFTLFGSIALSILLIGCGGGGSSGTDSGTDSGTGAYNPYSGTGIGSLRIKTITSRSSHKTTTYYYQAYGGVSKLSSVIEEAPSRTGTQTYSYNVPGFRLSKIIDEGSGGKIFELKLKYGTFLYEPLNTSAIISTIQTDTTSCQLPPPELKQTYTYAFDTEQLKALRVTQIDSKGEAALENDQGVCNVFNMDTTRKYSYDTVGRLTKVAYFSGINEVRTREYTYDSKNRIKEDITTLNMPGRTSKTKDVYNYSARKEKQINARKTYNFIDNKWELMDVFDYSYEEDSCWYHYPPYKPEEIPFLQNYCIP